MEQKESSLLNKAILQQVIISSLTGDVDSINKSTFSAVKLSRYLFIHLPSTLLSEPSVVSRCLSDSRIFSEAKGKSATRQVALK